MLLDDRKKIRTGDVLLFSGNTTTAFLIKFFSSSNYNHMGIAIRLDKNDKVTNEQSGTLYVLEINAIERYDVLRNKYVKGIALTCYDDLISNYNDIHVRHINVIYVNKKFCKKAQKFIEQHQDIGYSSTLGPIIGVWIGCPISGIQREKDEMFCSEMVAYFYLDVCGVFPTIEKPARLYKPDDFIYPNTGIFTREEYSIYSDYADASVSLIIPLIVGLWFAVLVSMLFPRKRAICG